MGGGGGGGAKNIPNGQKKMRNPVLSVVRNLSSESWWQPHQMWLR